MNEWIKHYEDLLPEDCLAISGVRVLRVLAEDGTARYAAGFGGDENLSQTIGTLFMLIHQWLHDEEPEA